MKSQIRLAFARFRILEQCCDGLQRREERLKDEFHAAAPQQRVAGGPGHPLRGRQNRTHQVVFKQYKIRLLGLTSDNRFGHDWDPTCMKMDETLYSIAEKCKNFVVIYLVDITEVPDFNKMYELYDPCTVMFFFRYVSVRGLVSPRDLMDVSPFQKQAHHDRFGHGKQQQDQLGDGGQAGDDRHRRDRLQRRQKGPRSRRLAQRLLHQIQILSEEI